MTRLPVISGKDLIKILSKVCFKPIRQKGSHVRLRRGDPPPVTVPLHKELKRGTLLSTISYVAEILGCDEKEVRAWITGRKKPDIPCPLSS
mgnify:CR=1 FL=1